MSYFACIVYGCVNLSDKGAGGIWTETGRVDHARCHGLGFGSVNDIVELIPTVWWKVSLGKLKGRAGLVIIELLLSVSCDLLFYFLHVMNKFLYIITFWILYVFD